MKKEFLPAPEFLFLSSFLALEIFAGLFRFNPPPTV